MLRQEKAKIAGCSVRIPYHAGDALPRLSESLHSVFGDAFGRPIVVVCVGSDRATGDAFGPIIGTKLASSVGARDIAVYGTLHEPVHAKNLEAVLSEIDKRFYRPFILAVDACLGRSDHVGHITLEKGPLRAGAGVGKTLPPFGDYCLMGVVNVGGLLEQLVLQNTRLGIVMQMAELVSIALEVSLRDVRPSPSTAPPSTAPVHG